MLLLKRQSQSGHYCDEVNGTHTEFNIIGCAVLFLTGRSNAGRIIVGMLSRFRLAIETY